MAHYKVYRDETENRALAFVSGSELDTIEAQTLTLLAAVEADPTEEFSPRASAFQGRNTNEYIRTGLPYPYSLAVVVH